MWNQEWKNADIFKGSRSRKLLSMQGCQQNGNLALQFARLAVIGFDVLVLGVTD